MTLTHTDRQGIFILAVVVAVVAAIFLFTFTGEAKASEPIPSTPDDCVGCIYQGGGSASVDGAPLCLYLSISVTKDDDGDCHFNNGECEEKDAASAKIDGPSIILEPGMWMDLNVYGQSGMDHRHIGILKNNSQTECQSWIPWSGPVEEIPCGKTMTFEFGAYWPGSPVMGYVKKVSQSASATDCVEE